MSDILAVGPKEREERGEIFDDDQKRQGAWLQAISHCVTKLWLTEVLLWREGP